MPYIKHRVRTLGVSLFAAVLLSSAVPALAAAATCPAQPVSHPFAPIGDGASYVLVQGGTFESGAPGWSTKSAQIIADNVATTGGKHALVIQGESSATSAPSCVSSEDPTFRFMLRTHTGTSRLNVDLIWTDTAGATQESAVATVKASSSWHASPTLALASNLPLSEAGSSINPVRVVFEVEGANAVEIAGIYIDPYRR